MSLSLTALGWKPAFEHEFEHYASRGCVPARVSVQHRGAYVVYTEAGERWAEPAGRLRHLAAGAAELPVVGDWVALADAPGADAATIHGVLPRRTAFSRQAAGAATVEQVVAANVDTVLLVSAFGPDLNHRRIERYLVSAWESGAAPAIVLNKSDLAVEAATTLAAVEAVAGGVPIHAVSCASGAGLDELLPYLEDGGTVALLGSSGVGKTSLVNRLAGTGERPTLAVRSDGKGRHATTRRELVLVPGGGLLLDTPGMRTLSPWAEPVGLDGAFDDIAALAAGCRFGDCMHEREPGCGVLAAVEEGVLAPERLAGYRKLLRELDHLESQRDGRRQAEQRRERRRAARSRRRASW